MTTFFCVMEEIQNIVFYSEFIVILWSNTGDTYPTIHWLAILRNIYQNKDSLIANNEIGAGHISDFGKFPTWQCEFDSLIFRN